MLVLDPFVIMAWLLLTGLFPISYFWFRNAYKIAVQKDLSRVALKGGDPPENPAKWAPFVALLNFAAAGALVWAVIGALPIAYIYPFEKWSGIAAVTIWFKIFGDYIIKMHAHSFRARRSSEK